MSLILEYISQMWLSVREVDLSNYEFSYTGGSISSNYVINDGDGKYPMDDSILNTIYREISVMFCQYKRVLVFRLDLHVCCYEDKNHSISKLMTKVRDHIKTQYGIKKMGYVWVREQEKSKKQHYHLMFILNGNKISYPSKLVTWVELRWMGLGHPKPYTPKNCFYFMDKKLDADEIEDCIYRVSYMAKKRGKGYAAKSARDFSSSRVNFNLNKNQEVII